MSAPAEEFGRGDRDAVEYTEPIKAVEWGVSTLDGEGVGRLDEEVARTAAECDPNLTLIWRWVVLYPWKVAPTE